jgi:hypothetical protein
LTDAIVRDVLAHFTNLPLWSRQLVVVAVFTSLAFIGTACAVCAGRLAGEASAADPERAVVAIATARRVLVPHRGQLRVRDQD